MSKSEHLQLVDEYAKWIKERRDDKEWSLNYDKYKARLAKSEAFAKKFDSIDDYDTELTYNSLPYEQQLFKKDTILQEKRERWHKNLAKDAYVEEALNVLNDLKINNIRRDKLVTIKD